MPSLTNPLKWHGGKQYLAKRIVSLFPRHLHYVEAFAGGLAVLLERDPNDKSLWLSEKAGQCGVSEVANDINDLLMNFWIVLSEPQLFQKFFRQVNALPLGRELFHGAAACLDGVKVEAPCYEVRIKIAVDFFVCCRQSLAGRFQGFTSLTRNRTRRGINGNASEWLGAVDGLAAVHARLQPVVLENMPALKLIEREDAPHTLFYLDPPYLHDTRTTKDAYAHEMTEQDHRELLDTIRQCKGKVILSGYPSPLYDEALASWNRHTIDIANHAAGGKSKQRKTETLWCNY